MFDDMLQLLCFWSAVDRFLLDVCDKMRPEGGEGCVLRTFLYTHYFEPFPLYSVLPIRECVRDASLLRRSVAVSAICFIHNWFSCSFST